jgi:NAD(P)-dependent dehydrogenase (short-subunit alcohol dehydrogenase family)
VGRGRGDSLPPRLPPGPAEGVDREELERAVTISWELVGSTAVVTGAAQGIGYDVASHLMAAGANVLLFDINGEGVATAAQTLGETYTNRRAVAFSGDVTDEEAWRSAFDLAAAELGPVTILVNNALFNKLNPILRLPLEEFKRVFDVIVNGTFLGTREFGRRFMEQGLQEGVVINVSTLNYTIPATGLAGYCSAKAALSMFTKVAALEFAPMGIRVNAVAPALTDTPLARAFFGASPEVPEAFIANTPLGRIGYTEDQARVVLFLASRAGAWMTGNTLVNDGGMHLVGLPDNWAIMKGPLGMTDPTPAEWQRS